MCMNWLGRESHSLQDLILPSILLHHQGFKTDLTLLNCMPRGAAHKRLSFGLLILKAFSHPLNVATGSSSDEGVS